MEAVPLASETIRISFAGLSTSLAAQPGSCSQLLNAADIEVKIETADKCYKTARGHLSAEHGAILHLAIPATETISSLTVELSEVGFGNVVAIGATAKQSFRNLCEGNLEIALICPDVLKFTGSLCGKFVRTGRKLAYTKIETENNPGEKYNINNNNNIKAKVVPAGLLASGELACVPRSVLLHSGDGYECTAQVSRSALLSNSVSVSDSLRPFGSDEEPIVLELCRGEAELPGGTCDLNVLAAKAVDALADSANGVIALATNDVQIATVLMAIAPPDTPAIWTGITRKDVAKRLRMPASIHPDFYGGIYVEKKELVSSDTDDTTAEEKEVLHVPVKLLGVDDGDDDNVEPENDNRLKRKKSSVRWASPLSTRCSIEEDAGGAA